MDSDSPTKEELIQEIAATELLLHALRPLTPKGKLEKITAYIAYLEKIDVADKKAFANMLRPALWALSLISRTMLARKCGVSLKTITRWEERKSIPCLARRYAILQLLRKRALQREKVLQNIIT